MYWIYRRILHGNGRGWRREDVVRPRNRGSSYNYLNSYRQNFQTNGYISPKTNKRLYLFRRSLIKSSLYFKHVENWKLRVCLFFYFNHHVSQFQTNPTRLAPLSRVRKSIFNKLIIQLMMSHHILLPKNCTGMKLYRILSRFYLCCPWLLTKLFGGMSMKYLLKFLFNRKDYFLQKKNQFLIVVIMFGI